MGELLQMVLCWVVIMLLDVAVHGSTTFTLETQSGCTGQEESSLPKDADLQLHV